MKKPAWKALIAVLACYVLQAPSALADPKIKEGTWEMTVAMQGLPIPIPPQKVTFCVDKKNYVPKNEQQEKDCKFVWNTVGNTVHWTMKCSDSGTEGKSQVTYNWDRMDGKQEIRMSGGQVMNSQIGGRWLATGCDQAQLKDK